MANGNQIQRVLLNLLINARQAMPEGGSILVRLRPAEDKKYIELVVRDSGQGIPREKLPRIFEAFYSTKAGPDESGKGGTGLGLAACKEIVDAHRDVFVSKARSVEALLLFSRYPSLRTERSQLKRMSAFRVRPRTVSVQA